MTGVANSLLLAATGDPWTDYFFGIESKERFVLLIIIIGCVTGIIISLAGITAGVANSLHRRRVEEGLKRDLIDRGMSADEIVKIVEAAPPPEDAAGRWVASWCKKK
jgi:hypothetical protein